MKVVVDESNVHTRTQCGVSGCEWLHGWVSRCAATGRGAEGRRRWWFGGGAAGARRWPPAAAAAGSWCTAPRCDSYQQALDGALRQPAGAAACQVAFMRFV